MASKGFLTFVAAFLIVGVGLGLGIGYFAWGRSATIEEQVKVVIAIQPTQAATEISDRAKELETFLESKTGYDVKIYIPTTYAAVVESIRFGHADVAFMSAWPSYIASKLTNAEIVLAEVREVVVGEEKRSEPFYFSYWIVLKNSHAKSLADLRGKKACFPSPVSTSGYVFPLAKLVEEGFVKRPDKGEADPKSFFGEVLFAGGYGQCWSALKAGQVDVTVIAGDVSEKIYKEVMANTNVLDQQGPIPSHAVVMRKDIREPVKSKVLNALMELGKEEHRSLMRKFVSGTFLEFSETTTAKHVSGLQRALELSGLKFVESFG